MLVWYHMGVLEQGGKEYKVKDAQNNMAFIINKKSSRNGKIRILYYLVENYRVGKKVKRKKLLDLHECKNLSELLQAIKDKKVKIMQRLIENQNKVEYIIQTGKNPPLSFGSVYATRRYLERDIEKAKDELEACRKKTEIVTGLM